MKEENSCSSTASPQGKPPSKLDRGRWKPEEHQLFLEGIKLYGRDWKKIERLVGSRSGPQIRSHAQKYFNKLSKEKEIHDASSDPSLSNRDSSSSIFTLPDLKMTRKKEHDKAGKKSKRKSQSKNEDIAQKSESITAKDPLNLEEMKYLTNPVGGNNLNSLFPPNLGKRMYSEDEVLLLIKNLVKEFGNIMGKISKNQTSLPLNNGGFSNLNSILILSLMLNDQNKAGSSQNLVRGGIENMNSNILQSLPDFIPQKMPIFPPGSGLQVPPKSNDLSVLLNSQISGKKEEKISSENLLKIPKIVSCPGINNPNLDINLGGGFMPQSENSYNFQNQARSEVPKFPSDQCLVKKYDSCQDTSKDSYQGEGKEELFSNPTLESKQDAN